jgi:hypothetical protein
MTKKATKNNLFTKFDQLPTPVKIIIFTQLVNFLLVLSEMAVFDSSMVIDRLVRGVVATCLNLALWYIAELKK